MELSHFELELSVGESIQIGNKLITAIDTPEHGIALLVESIPDDDDFDVVGGCDFIDDFKAYGDYDFDVESEQSVTVSRPR